MRDVLSPGPNNGQGRWALDRIFLRNSYFTHTRVWLAIFFCLQFAAWWALIEHNYARVLEIRVESDARVMGSDVREYTRYFRQYPESAIFGSKKYLRQLPKEKENVFEEFLKRPLFAPIFIAFNWLLSLFGVGYLGRLLAFASLFASLSGLLMCLLLRSVNWTYPQAALGALFCASSFSWLSTFSIPESYSLTISAALLCLISGHRLAQSDEALHVRSYRHAVICGIAAWLYPPLCGASLLVLSAIKERRQWLTIALPVVVIAMAVAVAPQLMTEIGGLKRQMRYGASYSSLANLLSLEWWRDVTAVFFFFSFVAPVRDFVTSSGRPDWGYVGSSWSTILAMLAMATGYCLLVARAIAGRFGSQLSGVVIWSSSLVLFSIVFNPKEVLLYASLPATLVAYCVSVVLGHERGWRIADPTRSTISTVALAIAFILLLCLNVPSILGL